jgi:sterol desaturase/sphingolipid hydroxylase (fatty acid hydroxylase superfamily)
MGPHADALGASTMELLAATLKGLLGPDGWSVLSFVYWQILWPLISQPSMHWVYLLSSLLLGCMFLVVTAGPQRLALRSLPGLLFPRIIWRHASTQVDVRFFLLNQLLMSHLRLNVWVIGLFGLLHIQELVQGLLGLVVPAPDPAHTPGVLALAAFTLSMGVAFDFARYLSHRLHHRIPVLWEFHKVHHSAEVLTVFSNYRNHPVETMLELLLRLVATVAVAAAFGCFYSAGLQEYTVLNYGALTFVYYVTAHLRHSHLPFDFGPLRSVFISPRMHHLHHSADPKHFDRNFGFLLSFWDRCAGTLYLPQPGETFQLGLPPEAGRFDSAWNLYLQPFLASYRLLVRPRGPRQPVARESGYAAF